MGKEDFEFLLKTRDEIIHSENRILEIDKNLSSIDEKIVALNSTLKELWVPKSDNWNEELNNEKMALVEKFESERIIQIEDLEHQKIEVSKYERREYYSLLIGAFIVLVLFAEGEWGILGLSLIQNTIAVVSCILYWLLIVGLSMTLADYESTTKISEKIDEILDEKAPTSNLDARLAKYKEAVNKKNKIRLELDNLTEKAHDLIEEKRNLAEQIKMSWDKVSHLVP